VKNIFAGLPAQVRRRKRDDAVRRALKLPRPTMPTSDRKLTIFAKAKTPRQWEQGG
jgi:hypothetical protein